MSDVQCIYHKRCEEAPNCGGAKVHDSRYCEPCPRHKDEKVCQPPFIPEEGVSREDLDKSYRKFLRNLKKIK